MKLIYLHPLCDKFMKSLNFMASSVTITVLLNFLHTPRESKKFKHNIVWLAAFGEMRCVTLAGSWQDKMFHENLIIFKQFT